jgi:hypothetical protein
MTALKSEKTQLSQKVTELQAEVTRLGALDAGKHQHRQQSRTSMWMQKEKLMHEHGLSKKTNGQRLLMFYQYRFKTKFFIQ